MTSRHQLSVVFDSQLDCAALKAGENVLPVLIYPLKECRRHSDETAYFCVSCSQNGAVTFPTNYESLPLLEARERIQTFVTECCERLKQAVELAATFPVKVGCEEGYIAAASRGKLEEFDRAAKAIVDEFSCGGFLRDWSATDAFAAFTDAAERNDWDLVTSLADARAILNESWPISP